jgi:hypothetical protein
MATARILGSAEQPLDRTWLLTATVENGAGALISDGDGLTAAVFSPTALAPWWNQNTGSWQAIRVENDMAEHPDLSGVYTIELDPAVLGDGDELDVLVLVSSGDAAEARALVHLRHSARSQPVIDRALTAAPATRAELDSLLAAFFGGSVVVDDSEKKLIVYQSDGVTPCIEFNLKDAAGNPSTMEPFQRLVP